MTFKSKRVIASMVAGAAQAVAYIVYMLSTHAPAPEDVRAWALTMLVFIGIAIVANIIIQILFHIAYSVGVAVKERAQDDKKVERIIAAETDEDEMDKLVSLKSSRIGYVCIGIGFIAALVGLAFLGASAVVALHILLGAFFAGSFIEGGLSVYFYERGV